MGNAKEKGKITAVMRVIHHPAALMPSVFVLYMIHSSWFISFLVCFQDVIQNCKNSLSLSSSSKHTWREIKKAATERCKWPQAVKFTIVQLVTYHHTDNSATNTKSGLILQCLWALLFAFHCWQSFCLIFSTAIVPCGPPYLDLWEQTTRPLFPAHSGLCYRQLEVSKKCFEVKK